MRGVILAGGKGTRLLPATKIINKHLIPILNEPMILFPLRTLIGMGIKDILIVSGGEHIGGFAEFLGDGSEYGVELTYKVQKEAGGIAQALSLAKKYVGQEEVFAVILGDNIFEQAITPPSTPTIVVKEVEDPHRFGVYDGNKITEKPTNPSSNKAVTGLYFYDGKVFDFIETLKPSERGELEITDVNNWYLERGMGIIEYPGFWSDAGTPESLRRTINFISTHST